MSIATQIEALQADKAAIAAAITAKGGTVGSGDGFDDFATDIGTIPSGGSASPNITTATSLDGYSLITSIASSPNGFVIFIRDTELIDAEYIYSYYNGTITFPSYGDDYLIIGESTGIITFDSSEHSFIIDVETTDCQFDVSATYYIVYW